MGTPQKVRIGQVVRDAGRTTLSYVQGQMLVAAVMTALYAAGFLAIGLPWWLPIAFVCGVFHLVPILGGVLALMIPLFVVCVTNGGVYQALWVVAIFAVAQGLEGFYLGPKILGRRLALNPFVVFFAVLLGSLTFGVVGALLAPLVVAIGMIVYRATKTRQDGPGYTSSR